jgi:hypothetical protein
MGGEPAVEAARLGAFRETLERLGWVDGRTVRIEVRYAGGGPTATPAWPGSWWR